MFLILDHKRKEKAREADVGAQDQEKVPELHDGVKSEHQAPDDTDLLHLVERARAGDDEAFSELVLGYERFVYNTACRALSAGGRSIDVADDVAQAAFIKAWRNIKSFRGDCTFSTWLYRITVNTARDLLRVESRRPTVSLTRDDEADDDGSEWDIPLTSGDTVPEDALDRKEAILAVRRAIEELPEDQRQVIVMRDLHELSYQEISETLGVEMGTVRSRINRGRQKLKNILENGNFFNSPSSKG